MEFRCSGTGSSGNSYSLISDDGEILLIECGVRWSKILKMINFKTSSVAGCIATHAHLDHILSAKDVIKYGIQIYTNDETADWFENITGEKMIGKPARIPFKCGTYVITPFYLPHTTKDKETKNIISCPNFGYIIQQEPEMGNLLYMTDMEYCPYSFKGIRPNHLVIECNYIDELVDYQQNNYVHRLQGHCSLKTCKGIIKANTTHSLRNIILIHLSDTASDEKRILEEIGSIVPSNVNVQIAGTEPISLNKYPF